LRAAILTPARFHPPIRHLQDGGARLSVEIVPVRTSPQWRDFHHLPFRIYGDDPNWVPPLLLERKLHFSPRHNPYFQHARAAYWLAYDQGKPVGRISAQIDRLHLETHGDSAGQFGFIEAIDDAGVFAALLRAGEDWLRGEGMKRAVGPISFSLWDQPGLLVEGFDTPPYVMMGHARPYFAPHIEAAGFAPIQDLLAYSYNAALPPMALRIVERLKKRDDVVVRPIRMDKAHFESEVATLLEILNDAWSGNWGFVPMTKAEIADLAGLLKLLLRPGDVAIAEYRGHAAAMAVCFPNLHEAIRDMDGRLLPFNWAKLLWRMKVRRPKSGRMPLMGVRRELQNTPIGAALALSVIQATRDFNFANGVEASELSWILDGNERVKHIIELVGGTPYKRYRIYQKTL
jgi:hypothetical protein